MGMNTLEAAFGDIAAGPIESSIGLTVILISLLRRAGCQSDMIGQYRFHKELTIMGHT